MCVGGVPLSEGRVMFTSGTRSLVALIIMLVSLKPVESSSLLMLYMDDGGNLVYLLLSFNIVLNIVSIK